VEDWNCGDYRSICNHCNVTGRQAIEFGDKKTQNMGYYDIQGHQGRYQSKARMRLYWRIQGVMQSGHGPHHGFREGPALPRLQKELLKVGGSWRSAGFFARFACDYIKNIPVLQAYI